MGHVSSIVKGESTSSKSGVWWQEEKLPDGDILSGKYQSISHYSDGNYAKVWYVGNRFDPERTYTSAYCQKNNLGKYANSGTSSKSSSSSSSSKGFGLGAAIGGGVVGLAKKAFEETPEEKAAKKERIEEHNRIVAIVDENIDRLKNELKVKYPLDTKDAAIMLGYITALHGDILSNKDISKDGDDFDSKLTHRLEKEQLQCKGKHLRKLLIAFKKKTEFKTIYKDAEKYSGRRANKLLFTFIIIFIFTLLMIIG